MRYAKDPDQYDIFPVTYPYWDDVRTPLNAFQLVSGREPNWVSYKGCYVLEMTDEAVEANEKRVTCVVQMPHTYKEGTDIKVHVHWIGEDNTAGDVYWELTYSWANKGDAFPAEATLYKASANSGTTDAHNVARFASIDGTGMEISSMLLFSLTRYSSNVLDTFNSKSAYLLELDVHFQVDSLGSVQELSKE